MVVLGKVMSSFIEIIFFSHWDFIFIADMDLVLHSKLMHPTFLRLKIMKRRFFVVECYMSVFIVTLFTLHRKKRKKVERKERRRR